MMDRVAGDKPREAAFLALLASMREEEFLIHALERWQRAASPAPRDFALAYEIASGTCRMRLELGAALEQVAGRPLTLKRKGRALLHCGAYQLLHLDRVPSHAAVDETVALAKKYGHTSLARLINALLRKMAKEPPDLSCAPLYIRTSFPPLFVEAMGKQFGSEETETILHQLNAPPVVMGRRRSSGEIVTLPKGEVAPLADLVIQNATSIELLTRATSDLTGVNRILDLCAAPGGKAVLLRDLFPEAELVVNEPSKKRRLQLVETLERYRVEAEVTGYLGEEFPKTERFDLVVIDAPCSNSGVYHKRPEARWRFDEKHLEPLLALQRALIERALLLGDAVCYTTCSIYDRENIDQVAEFDLAFKELRLPASNGVDGGFVAQLRSGV